MFFATHVLFERGIATFWDRGDTRMRVKSSGDRLRRRRWIGTETRGLGEACQGFVVGLGEIETGRSLLASASFCDLNSKDYSGCQTFRACTRGKADPSSFGSGVVLCLPRAGCCCLRLFKPTLTVISFLSSTSHRHSLMLLPFSLNNHGRPGTYA